MVGKLSKAEHEAPAKAVENEHAPREDVAADQDMEALGREICFKNRKREMNRVSRWLCVDQGRGLGKPHTYVIPVALLRC